MKRLLLLFTALVAVLSAAAVASAANRPGAYPHGTTTTALSFATVRQAETLILRSQFATGNALTDVSCIGLPQPTPRLNAAGALTFHRFRCHLSGAYFDVMATVALTGHGGFTVRLA